MKETSPVNDHFTDGAHLYDERNRSLAPIFDNMHFLMRLILKRISVRARVLCVGVGTGAEILALSKSFPEWTFVGVDPSAGMLDVCRERLTHAGLIARCELIHGYVDDVPLHDKFDAVLSILVAHFVKREERFLFYMAMCDRLRTNGILINTEISDDLDAPHVASMVQNWAEVQSLMGATAESIANLPNVLRDMLSVISPTDTEKLLMQCGIALPVRFFQAFMISGWYGVKT